MRVGLDMQLAIGTPTGIGEFVTGLARALRDRGVDVALLQAPGLNPWRFDRRLAWDQALLPLAAARAHVDLLHCASGTVPCVAATPRIVTVHDVAWLRVQGHAKAYARAYFGRFALWCYARARRICVSSEFSRAELLDVTPLDPARIDVVYPGVASDFAKVIRRRDDDAPFVLAVGTVEARKNLAVVIAALPAVPKLRLISVGPPTPYVQTCVRLARDLGVADRFEVRGFVTREEVLTLYARALVAVVPSRYEGFGYGVAQALCAGVPLVAADAASLPEVAAGSAPLVAPDDVAGWAAAMRAVADGREAADVRAAEARPAAQARFSWPTAADAMARSYRRALE